MFDQDNELHTSFIGKWLECESNFNLDTCSNTISHFASSMHICQRLRCTGSRPNGTKKNYNKIDNKIIKNLNSFGYIAVGQGRMASLLLFFSCSSSWPPLEVGQGQLVKVGQAWPRRVKDGQGGQGQVRLHWVQVAVFSSLPLSSCCSTLYITAPTPWPRSHPTLLWSDVGRRKEATLLLLLPTRCTCQRFGGIIGVRRHQFINRKEDKNKD